MTINNVLLPGSKYFLLNKQLVRKIGLESTIILSELVEKEEFDVKNHLIKNGYFISNLDILCETTTLSQHRVKNALNNLYKKEFIDVVVKRNKKIYVKILHPNILNKVTNNIQNIKSKEKVKKSPYKKKRFKKPTIKELKNYFLQQGSIDESEIMFDYYESKGWKVGNAPMKCWKSAARNWLRRSVNLKTEFPDYYDKKTEINIGNDNETLRRYHKHLRTLGWTSTYSPTAGTSWKKKKI